MIEQGERRYYRDLWYMAVAVPAGEGWHVDFHVYRLSTQDEPPGYMGSDFPTWDEAEAVRYLHGHIKWDACSDWHFDAQDEAMLHFCGEDYIEYLSQLLLRLHAWAAELMPQHAGNFREPDPTGHFVESDQPC